ncbi:MAG: tail fiber domain-containing protein, partial [Cytophagaceae bacterium]
GSPPTSSLLTLQGTSMLLGFRSSSTDRYTFGLSSNGLNLYENSNGYKTRLFFKDGGNIGIGTSNPGHPLTLQANSPGSGGAMLGLYDSGGTDKFNFSLDGGGLNLSESNVAAGRLYVRYGGNVGIGTTTPLARLHVSGSTTLQATGGPASFFNPGGSFNSTGSLSGLKQAVAYFEGGEVWVNGYIVAGSLQTVSDRRLKHVLGLSDRAADLVLLQRLRITDYTYIDQVNNPTGVIKKVIAQEVEQVLPTAVSRSTQALPNVYEKATKLSYADGYLTVTTARPHELPARGGRMRFYTPTNQSIDPDVTVLDAHTVRFASAEAHAAGLFVYGKYVDDFRSVDYDALTTLT